MEPMFSPTMTTPVGPLTFQWQMSIQQHPSEARVSLIHKTEGIPNLGVEYIVYILRKDGGSSELTSQLAKTLARKGESNVSIIASIMAGQNVNKEKYVFPDKKVRIRLLLKISRARFSPKNILNKMIDIERKEMPAELMDGTVGQALWNQVEIKHVQDTPPPGSDVEFRCADEVSIYAHKAVLASFSESLYDTFVSGVKGRWTLDAKDLESSSVREVLYFVYLRRPSPTLHKAPLNEVLQAQKILQIKAEPLKLEVEKLITGDDPEKINNLTTDSVRASAGNEVGHQRLARAELTESIGNHKETSADAPVAAELKSHTDEPC